MLMDSKRYVDFMTKDWLRLNLTNVGSLNGVFLASCRDLLEKQHGQPQSYIQLAIQYKMHCVQALREAITSEMLSLISDSTVAITMLLAYDEVRRKKLMLGLLLSGLEIYSADGFIQTTDTNR